MLYYDSLGAAGYPISRPCTTMECSYNEHLARGTHGVDYAVKTGTPVIAPAMGRTRNFSNASAGNAVELRHLDENGVETGYVDTFMHLSAFLPEGVYRPGDTIGISGSTGDSTGPHIHWVAKLGGNFVKQWLYFTPGEPDKAQEVARLEMIYIQCAETGITYLIGQQFISWPLGKDMASLTKSFGDPKPYAKTADVVAVAKSFGIPEDKVRNVPASRYWSKLDTVQPGGGATPAEIAKVVNDDVAKRMSS